MKRTPHTVEIVVGTGVAGFSDDQVNNPYGLTIGPDGALYFCDLGNQRIRRFDLATREMSTIVGNGDSGDARDGGPAEEASLNMPHELCFDSAGDMYIVERDRHVVRKVERVTGLISTVVGTGEPGFTGDDGPAELAQLCQPHSVALDDRGGLLICDVGNHRIRHVDLRTGVIDTFAGTGERTPTPTAAQRSATALNGPRTIVVTSRGDLFLALREGNAIYRIDSAKNWITHIAGTGAQGYSGDGGAARDATFAGPKGLAFDPSGVLYVADTENHAIRAIDLTTGVITTVVGTGEPAGGAIEQDGDALRLARPHGLWLDAAGGLYIADSEAHRILRVCWN